MKVSFPHIDLLIEHLAQGTKVSSILFDQYNNFYTITYFSLLYYIILYYIILYYIILKYFIL